MSEGSGRRYERKIRRTKLKRLGSSKQGWLNWSWTLRYLSSAIANKFNHEARMMRRRMAR